jgi:hypothetical protein
VAVPFAVTQEIVKSLRPDHRLPWVIADAIDPKIEQRQ